MGVAAAGRGSSRTTGTANAWEAGRRGVWIMRVMGFTGGGDDA